VSKPGIATLLLLAAAGCLPHGEKPPPPVAEIDAAPILAFLRSETERMQSFTCEGTVLLRWKKERHFLHFEALYHRPDRIRLDVDMKGPLGLGSGRLSISAVGESVSVLAPEENERRDGTVGDGEFPLLDEYRFGPAEGAVLLAPYGGDAGLLREEKVLHCGADARSGDVRIVLRRDDGRREVLLVTKERSRIVGRKIALPDGTVLADLLYRYDDEKDGLFAEEVEARFPAEDLILRTRFRMITADRPPPDDAFRLDPASP
jgi:hypothetical protein